MIYFKIILLSHFTVLCQCCPWFFLIPIVARYFGVFVSVFCSLALSLSWSLSLALILLLLLRYARSLFALTKSKHFSTIYSFMRCAHFSPSSESRVIHISYDNIKLYRFIPFLFVCYLYVNRSFTWYFPPLSIVKSIAYTLSIFNNPLGYCVIVFGSL